MVELAIALGVAINLMVSEIIGFTAAGLVVPGYLALFLGQPQRLAGTLLVAVATWAAMRFGLSRVIVLYGRRRLAIAVLLGFVLNAALDAGLGAMPGQRLDLRVIGHIVPGLIANEALGQGLTITLVTTLLVAAVVRVILLVLFGWAG